MNNPRPAERGFTPEGQMTIDAAVAQAREDALGILAEGAALITYITVDGVKHRIETVLTKEIYDNSAYDSEGGVHIVDRCAVLQEVILPD